MRQVVRYLQLLPVLLSFGLLACGAPASAPPPTTPQEPLSEARQSPTEAPDSALAARLVGTWGPTLPKRQARAVAIARWALAQPPSEAAFEAMGPSSEERDNFRSLLRLKAEEPDSPALTDVRRKLADYEAMLIVITPTHITFGTSVQQTRQAYRVVEAQGGALVLDAESERIEVRFLDQDHIAMRSGRELLLTRDAPTGYNEKDLRGELPTSRGPQESAAPATSGAGADDACSAYADCIDQMPQRAGDQPVMLGSASTIRSWERTPDRLRQCASALTLARSIGLCR